MNGNSNIYIAGSKGRGKSLFFQRILHPLKMPSGSRVGRALRQKIFSWRSRGQKEFAEEAKAGGKGLSRPWSC
jgi:hypothetical protein